MQIFRAQPNDWCAVLFIKKGPGNSRGLCLNTLGLFGANILMTCSVFLLIINNCFIREYTDNAY